MNAARAVVRAVLILNVTLLAACAGTQPPVATSGVPLQARVHDPNRGKSWMLPGPQTGNLLYVSRLDSVAVYSYPAQKIVGNLTGFQYAAGLCADVKGDVWVTDLRGSLVSEYAHGGTQPIETLSDHEDPVGCAVDPKTGNLAVANYTNDVYVYPSGSDAPLIYAADDFLTMQFCTYDGSGNLFVDGNSEYQTHVVAGLLKLPYGGTALEQYKLEKTPHGGMDDAGGLQWDGRHIVAGFATKQRNVLYRITDVGLMGRIAGRVKLVPPNPGYIGGNAPFVLYQRKIIGTYLVHAQQAYIATWPYPAGGNASNTLALRGKHPANGVAMSVASTRYPAAPKILDAERTRAVRSSESP